MTTTLTVNDLPPCPGPGDGLRRRRRRQRWDYALCAVIIIIFRLSRRQDIALCSGLRDNINYLRRARESPDAPCANIINEWTEIESGCRTCARAWCTFWPKLLVSRRPRSADVSANMCTWSGRIGEPQRQRRRTARKYTGRECAVIYSLASVANSGRTRSAVHASARFFPWVGYSHPSLSDVAGVNITISWAFF